MPARIAPATPPFSASIQKRLDAIMPVGAPPLVLFTTLARDERLFGRFMNAGLLDRGHLTLRQREIVIDRTTALCGSEYEWGVHVTTFGAQVSLTDKQVRSTVRGSAADDCWAPQETLLLRFCDALFETCTVEDGLWVQLRDVFSEEAMIELLLLAGFYRTVSYLTNALRLPLEVGAERFPPS